MVVKGTLLNDVTQLWVGWALPWQYDIRGREGDILHWKGGSNLHIIKEWTFEVKVEKFGAYLYYLMALLHFYALFRWRWIPSKFWRPLRPTKVSAFDWFRRKSVVDLPFRRMVKLQNPIDRDNWNMLLRASICLTLFVLNNIFVRLLNFNNKIKISRNNLE